VIWRLPHPVRGLVAGLLVLVGLPALTGLAGFGMGMSELLLVLLFSVGTCLVVATRTPSPETR
jgi:hypothetical protein